MKLCTKIGFDVPITGAACTIKSILPSLSLLSPLLPTILILTTCRFKVKVAYTVKLGSLNSDEGPQVRSKAEFDRLGLHYNPAVIFKAPEQPVKEPSELGDREFCKRIFTMKDLRLMSQTKLKRELSRALQRNLHLNKVLTLQSKSLSETDKLLVQEMKAQGRR
jgi:outer membrane lipopolysaccharide assembly protein LptE/RlpB